MSARRTKERSGLGSFVSRGFVVLGCGRVRVSAAAAACLAGVFAGMASAAHAQEGAAADAAGLPARRPIRLRLGVWSPVGGEIRRTAGPGPWPSLGVSYDVTRKRGGDYDVEVYADYAVAVITFGRGAVSPPLGVSEVDRVEWFGLGAAARFYPSGSARRRTRPYLGAGAGLYQVSLDRYGGPDADGRVAPGVKLLAGVQTSRFLAEAGYTVIGRVSGVNAGGLHLQAGVRF